jgi:ATP-binding cassette subfamily B protein
VDQTQAEVLGLAAEARARPRTMRDLPGAIASSLRLVHAAAGRVLRWNIAVQLVLALLASAQVLAAAWALQALVDLDRHQTSTAAALVPFLALVLPTLLIALVVVAKQQLQRLMTEQVEQATWERLLDVAGAVDLETYESPDFYDRLRRIEANTLVRPAIVSMSLADLLGGAFAIVTVGATLIGLAPLVVPLLLVASVPLLLAARRLGAIEFDFAVRVTAVLRERRYLREVLVGRNEAKELRALSSTSAFRRRHRALSRDYLDELRVQARRAGTIGLLAGAASSAATLLGLVLVFALVADGAATLPQAGAILVAVRLLAGRLQQVSSSIGKLVESSLFLQDLEEFETLWAPHSAATDGPSVDMLQELRLHDVSFRYPGATHDALHGISMSLSSGEVVALVGENGSGKTTLSKIVAQLFEPTGGAVTWNGSDTSTLDPAQRRRHVSVTFQDFARFALTAGENISVGTGRFDAPEVEVRAAARRAGADAVVEKLPHGYDTRLGKEFADGGDVSTGQWQRIALARAFHRDAQLVVLDEPTASLDPRAERALFDAVRSLFADRAVLLITHRLSTVRDADRIYVLDEGHLVEQGSHTELLDADGLYADLFTMQAAGFLDPT